MKAIFKDDSGKEVINYNSIENIILPNEGDWIMINGKRYNTDWRDINYDTNVITILISDPDND